MKTFEQSYSYLKKNNRKVSYSKCKSFIIQVITKHFSPFYYPSVTKKKS